MSSSKVHRVQGNAHYFLLNVSYSNLNMTYFKVYWVQGNVHYFLVNVSYLNLNVTSSEVYRVQGNADYFFTITVKHQQTITFTENRLSICNSFRCLNKFCC